MICQRHNRTLEGAEGLVDGQGRRILVCRACTEEEIARLQAELEPEAQQYFVSTRYAFVLADGSTLPMTRDAMIEYHRRNLSLLQSEG